LNVLRDQFKDRMVTQSYSAFNGETGKPNQRLVGSPNGYIWQDTPDSEFDGVDLIILEGDYSSESAYLATDCEEYDDIARALSDYPVLDDDELSQIEMEWCEEALQQIAQYDMARELSDEYLTDAVSTLGDVWDNLPEEKQLDLLRAAMDTGNIYAESEYNGSFVCASDLAPHVISSLCKGAALVTAYKLADGTLVDLGAPEAPYEEPDQYGRTDSMFTAMVNTQSAECYVAEWNSARHYVKGN
jgi:hypothetical protein